MGRRHFAVGAVVAVFMLLWFWHRHVTGFTASLPPEEPKELCATSAEVRALAEAVLNDKVANAALEIAALKTQLLEGTRSGDALAAAAAAVADAAALTHTKKVTKEVFGSWIPDWWPGQAWGRMDDCPLIPTSAHLSGMDRNTVYSGFIDFKLKAMAPGTVLRGLEIGALHNKAVVAREGVNMTYVDYQSIEQLRKTYSEDELKTFQLPDIVGNAETLTDVADHYADFYIWSHVIEHTELTLKALATSVRVTKPGGYIFLVAPNMCQCFDRQRLVTKWEHFEEEYLDETAAARNKPEHLREWAISHLTAMNQLQITDATNHRVNTTPAEIAQLANHFKNYPIHFHTFSPSSFLTLLVNAKVKLGFRYDIVFYGEESINMIAVLQRT
jgi:2-polyprenyl-3-methyl-5-hydroxy-6-metoxy-1,4-benzoquinol methylase